MKNPKKRRRLGKVVLKTFIWIFLAIFVFSAVGIAVVTSH